MRPKQQPAGRARWRAGQSPVTPGRGGRGRVGAGEGFLTREWRTVTRLYVLL